MQMLVGLSLEEVVAQVEELDSVEDEEGQFAVVERRREVLWQTHLAELLGNRGYWISVFIALSEKSQLQLEGLPLTSQNSAHPTKYG